MQQQGFQQGTFFVGCNYWASHAGMRMWSQWNEQIVEDDLRRLSENRICTLRVFPLWSDFQPLRMHCGGGGTPVEVRMGDQPLPDTEAGKAGVDETMLERFGRFCDLAEKYGIRQAPTLVYVSGEKAEKYTGVNEIRDYIKNSAALKEA